MKALSALIVCVSIAVPFAAYADMTDTQYCNALAAKYRQTIGNSNQSYAGVPEAIALCPTKPADSIPTLEKVLKDNKVTLPTR